MSSTPRLIKKYPNRRLYDTETSAYITLADVKRLVLDMKPFQVLDAKSNEDLTRSILLQIILEEEAGGTPLFSSQMLAHMIRFYGHAMQGMMGAYMEKTLQAFVEVQNRFQEHGASLYDGRGVPSPEMWSQFMQGQAPMMQNMMSNYIEQSKNLFFQMQDQMQQQARNVFQSFPGGFGQPFRAEGSTTSSASPDQQSGGAPHGVAASSKGAGVRPEDDPLLAANSVDDEDADSPPEDPQSGSRRPTPASARRSRKDGH